MKTRTATQQRLAGRGETKPIYLATIELTQPTPLTLNLSDRYLPAQVGSVVVVPEIPAVPEVPGVPAGSNLVLNSGFNTDLSNWTGGTGTWDAGNGGQMELSGVATRGQLVNVPASVVHEVLFTIRDAPVFVRVGSSQPNQELLPETQHDPGTHRYLLLSSTGQMWIQFTTISGTAHVDDVIIRTPGVDAIPAVPAVPAVVEGRVFGECLPMVLRWGALEESLSSLDGGGTPLSPLGVPATLSVTLDNMIAVGGRARFSDLIRSPLNPTGYVFEFARVTVYRLDDGQPRDTAERIGVFYLEDPTEITDVVTLRMSDVTLVLEEQNPVAVITRDEFPQAAAVQGQTIPRLIGTLTEAPGRFLVDGYEGSLMGAVTDLDTTIRVKGGDRFQSLTFLLDDELVIATARVGDTFTGCTRAAHGSVAEAHNDGTSALEILPEYAVVFGEHDGVFRPGTPASLKVNGVAARTSPTVETDLEIATVPGRRFVGARFTPTDVAAFHRTPLGYPTTVAVTPITFTLNGSGTSNGTKTVSVPLTAELSATRRRISWQVLRSGNFTGTIDAWRIRRRLAGGTDVLVAEGSVAANVGGVVATPSDEREYPTTVDEIITFTVTFTGTNGGGMSLIVNEYTVSGTRSGSGNSTASRVIGRVTCDIEGARDDAAGTISGTPGLLLDNPVDATAYLLRCYPSAALVELDSRWRETRALTAGIRWSALVGYDGPVRFSDLREMVSSQSRCLFGTESGAMRMLYVPDVVSVADTLDYREDVWDQRPAVANLTGRTQLFTRVIVQALRDYVNGGYRHSSRQQDLTQPGLSAPIETTLELPWIQGAETADALGTFWLRWWKRQRFQVQMVGWQGLLALEKGDAIAFTNHPYLEAHGGASLPFLIVKKSHRLGDPHPGRIELGGVEALV